MALQMELLASLILLFVNVQGSAASECSRFHYEEQLLEKVVRMETRFEDRETRISEMLASLEKIKAEFKQRKDEIDEKPRCSCPDEWVQFRGSCYFFGPEDVTFRDAESVCEDAGAHLTNIESSVENEFLQKHLRALKAPKHWIGYTDVEREGDWLLFPSADEPLFMDFHPTQPNNGRASNCAAFWESFGYQWVDEPCSNRFRPICEMKVF